MGVVIQGIPVVAGIASGEVLISSEPLSFWGGYDHQSGEITDRRHPLSGQVACGRILGVPFSRGSSTTTAVLLEAVRAGTAPAAMLTTGADAFFALASIVAKEMYGRPIPVIAISPEDYARIKTGDLLEILEDGRIEVK
jgi:predicted aconitase with swiveling domain